LPTYLTTHYVTRDENATKKEVLQRGVKNYDDNRDISDLKVNRLKVATRTLVGAIILAVVSTARCGRGSNTEAAATAAAVANGAPGVCLQVIIDAATK
jgi:hypothetical protein